jgi:diguanylate cyclase (GGDEF)-like protein/PAS domain S-box-containing protein
MQLGRTSSPESVVRAVGRRKNRARSPWSRRRQRGGVSLTGILESLEPAVIGRGSDGVICAWNSGAERLYGYSAEEMLGQTLDVIVPAPTQRAEADASEAAALVGIADSYDAARRCKDGTDIRVNTQISPVRDFTGRIVGASLVDRRVDGGGGHDSSAHRSTEYLYRAFEDAPIGIAIVSIDPSSVGSMVRVNRAMCDLTGYSSEELVSTSVSALLHPDDAATDLAAMEQLNAGEVESFQLEERLLHSERHAVWVTVISALVRDENGTPLFCIRQVQDIEERKRYEHELGYLVEHDPLTGLFNRRGFVRELTHEMAYARRYGGGGSVLCFDLDDLKRVNDTMGHDVGDEVLSEISRIVSDRLRETDSFGRMGGDEFAVLLPRTTTDEAQSLSTALLEAVRSGCDLSLPETQAVSMSIGIVAFQEPAESTTADDVLLEADDAMYAAKEAGRIESL